MKARKKPLIVEVVRFDRKKAEKNFAKDYPMVMDIATMTSVPEALTREDRFHIFSSQQTVLDGDYIIQGVQGEFYPCKPEIFEATYELVDGE